MIEHMGFGPMCEELQCKQSKILLKLNFRDCWENNTDNRGLEKLTYSTTPKGAGRGYFF